MKPVLRKPLGAGFLYFRKEWTPVKQLFIGYVCILWFWIVYFSIIPQDTPDPEPVAIHIEQTPEENDIVTAIAVVPAAKNTSQMISPDTGEH